MNTATIKKDLRQLKKTIHIIESLKKVQERYIQRIEALSRLVQTPKIKEQIETTRTVLSLMNIDEYVKEATEIECRYMSGINQLEPFERSIVLDHFVNDTPYWKLGLNLGYSEDGIRKKVDRAVRKLANLIK